MTSLWLIGLFRRRAGRLAAVAIGVAISVALLASLGAFLSSAKATMTNRAVRGVAVDWQVALSRGADPAAAVQVVGTETGVVAAVPVGYAVSDGLRATTNGATQTTGPARVLGLPGSYAPTFPGEIRLLSGRLALPDTASSPGPVPALLAQQTASNLAARVGDVVTVGRDGLFPLLVRVAGVVDLPQVESLFQKVGAPPTAQAQAPPDNGVIVGARAWHRAFDPVARTRPDLVGNQVHALLSHALPADPAAAYSRALESAHHLEARLAGGGIVANNLAAALDGARQDALYAQVLFVFLGLPGVLLAAALTVTVAAAGTDRRRREQALLRLRGAQPGQVLRLSAVEAGAAGLLGALVGLGAALAIGQASFGTASFGATRARALWWMGASALSGLAVAGIAVLVPARRDLRNRSVVAGRAATSQAARATSRPLALRLGADVILLAGAAVVYHITSRAGYSLVLAPEGVATISVSYWAFAGPALFWLGAALLTWRLVDLLLRRGRRPVAWVARPFCGPLAGLAVAAASRQRALLARASVLAGLALVFAVSTAVFNDTYRAQTTVDARLTNGADISVIHPPGTPPRPDELIALARVRGVRHVEPLMHRYAYIGADLQDIFGVRPATIASSTSLQNAYFVGGTAQQLIGRLAARPDAVLVSSETVKDYQLSLGDALVLRLQDTRSSRLTAVTFHYAGIVKEFPTAPRDSFFVTNAAYLAHVTGNPSAATILLGTSGDPHKVADLVRATLGAGPVVTDITTTGAIVGSSLTAVDLAGLTRVELGFGLVLAVAGGGLVLGLGLAERRRDLAIVSALGASGGQLRALVRVDTAVVTLCAAAAGILGGSILAHILVKVLSGVFDPAPAGLTVPWAYLAAVAALSVVGVTFAARLVVFVAQRRVSSFIRDL